MSLCRARRGNTRPGGARAPRKCQEFGTGAGSRGGNAPHSRRPAEKKKVEKEAFQVKLLGSEQPRFREMTRGGRTHRVPRTLLASAAPARRGYATAAPARATGAGPRGAARRRRSAPGSSGPWSARPSSPPRPFTPERRRRSRVCPAEGEGQAGGGGGGVVVPLQRGLLCPCAEMTHGVPSRHARAQRTDTHKERGKYTAPARRPQQLPGPPRPGPPRAAPTPQPCASPHPTWRPNSARARSAKYRTRVPGKCGADQAGCAVAAAPGQTDGRVAATSMPGWGREQGRGRKGGLP